jgi:ceramide glucosyltransferase
MQNAWGLLITGLIALAALGGVVTSVCHALVWRIVRHRTCEEPSDAKVTILKPLCGADASLAHNLQTCSEQSHQNLNLILGVADPDDDALPVALRFCRQTGRPARVSVGEDASLENPKVALLERMSWHSDGDWLVVSDSNVRVSSGYVRDALSHADPGVGLVTHLVCGSGGSSFAAHAENLQLNCFIAQAMCGARFLAGQTCVIGKSMFLRREALEAIGGFQAVGHYLAEDYVMGQAIERAGYRVVVVEAPVPAWHEGWTIQRFVNRHLRWAVMRRCVSRSAFLCELLFMPGPLLMLALGLALAIPSAGMYTRWLWAGLAVLQLENAVSYWRMTDRRVPIWALLVDPLRQWLAFGIWIIGWFVETVEWRGKAYRVGVGSKLQPVTRAVAARVPDEA